MLVKNMLKKIGHSFGRFASLVAIIFIGVGFYAGIRQSTPAIRDFPGGNVQIVPFGKRAQELFGNSLPSLLERWSFEMYWIQ